MAVRKAIQLFLLIALPLTGCRSGSDAELEGVATVKEVHGEVTYKGSEVTVGQEIQLDEPINVGKGSAVLAIPHVGEVRLFARTRIRVQAGSKLRLTLGKIWCLITELGASPDVGFEVETENAVAGVRGTEFVVAVSEEETQVSVLEGVVDVANAEQPKKFTRVSARKRTRVTKKKLPEAPEEFVPEEETIPWDTLQTELGVEPPPEEEDSDEDEEEGKEESGTLDDVKEELQEEAEDAKSKAKRKAAAAKSEAARQAEEARQAMEREAEETRNRLKQEAAETKEKLKKESEDTKKKLDDEKKSVQDEMRRQEEEMRKQMKDMDKGKSLKDL